MSLAPDRGGALLAWRIGGEDMLRPAPVDARDPLAMASFPLVPYANRVANGRFAFGGRNYCLPRNFGDHPHSLHGLGWLSRWEVQAAGPDSATLCHDHPGSDAWPWPYSATQRIELTGRGLTISLVLRNDATGTAPVGLGFHPYFPISRASFLQFEAAGLWLSEPPDHLPLALAPADGLGDWSTGAAAKGTSLIDHYYAGWDGVAILSDHARRRLTLTATGARGLHVYRPPDAGFLCLEPVSHMPDVINRPDGMDELEPGQSRMLTMSIALSVDED
ncbi:aldose 1-epimerase [Sphingobium sp. MI1205]|uniref:aldose 1-epimerase n=1 Tax=Sphingobium sp. MI1205 TaxID=407020 RepID=UPI00077036B3|nr:aldose 1-epimerase [Sphingobium sp. MI1205]AMK16596.1 putative epimerase [Sphingobium sp. MI1205]